MYVNEKFANEGLFTAIDKIKPLPFRDLMSPAFMDMYYNLNYGNRTLTSKGQNLSVNEMAELFSNMFQNKWEKIYNVYKEDVSLNSNYTETITELIDDKGENKENHSSLNTNSVNAYNDDDFVGDKKDETNQTTNLINSNTKNRTYSKSYLKGSKTDNLLKVINYLQNDYINDIIITDINNIITLTIFD